MTRHVPQRPIFRADQTADQSAELRDLRDRVRRVEARRHDCGTGPDGAALRDMRARIAACEADLAESRFDNMPI